jgi:hypothetical protein
MPFVTFPNGCPKLNFAASLPGLIAYSQFGVRFEEASNGDLAALFYPLGTLALVLAPLLFVNLFLRSRVPAVSSTKGFASRSPAFAWVAGLARSLRADRDPEIRDSDSALLARYVELRDRPGAVTRPSDAEALERCVKAIVETSPTLSETRRALDGFRAGAAKLDPERARAFFTLEHGYESLMNRRIYVQSLFFAAIGRLLAGEQGLRAADIERLDAQIALVREKRGRAA